MKPDEQAQDPRHGTDARPEDQAQPDNNGQPEQDTDKLERPTRPRTPQEQDQPDVAVNNSVNSEHPGGQ
ncbi:hypothetical protein [Pseudomonas cremoricolorata]|uniref:Uncharacterized protein n=1 Tax=Pseudomonas cremoricolorata TaxID=157783 RepID=A0A089YHQ8_9PSED|nr:hypothetical protein [Pseudomonas cremoricolorata]AIR91218.1 hypothetical protein LK03_18945 [Pseudomonas cremoricolorata]